MRKRLLSLAMALCMVLSLQPAAAFADENAEAPVCTCEEACTSETMNTECAVCGAGGGQKWKAAASIQCLQRKHRQR